MHYVCMHYVCTYVRVYDVCTLLRAATYMRNTRKAMYICTIAKFANSFLYVCMYVCVYVCPNLFLLTVASPKSPSFTTCFFPTKKFSALMSLWMNPFSCRCAFTYIHTYIHTFQ